MFQGSSKVVPKLLLKRLVFFILFFAANFQALRAVDIFDGPACLYGKITTGSLCELSIGDYWYKTILAAYNGSAKDLASAHCPSAMVDVDGTLYFASVTGIQSIGVEILIGRYLTDGTSTTKKFYPYKLIFGDSISLPKEPNTTAYDHAYLFNETIHTALTTSLMQEFSDCNYFSLLIFIPPGRWMNVAKDNEGIMYHEFLKSNLQPLKSEGSNYSFYTSTGNGLPYRTDVLRPRRLNDDAHVFAPNMGEIFGWKSIDKVGFVFSTLDRYGRNDRKNGTVNLWYQYNHYRYQNSSINCVKQNINLPTMNRAFPRFILVDNYIYSIISNEGANFMLMRTPTDNPSVMECMGSLWHYVWVATDREGSSRAPYNHDFCILKASDGTLVCGAIGFMGKRWYTRLPAYKPEWSGNETLVKKYSTHNYKNTMLLFTSFPVPTTPGDRDFIICTAGVQNVLYETNIGYQNDSAVEIDNKTASDDRRLYLNTHKICTYKSPKTGVDYLFYCYCYPGKTQQLYLGFAPYYINNSDKYNVVLLTKTEFRDKNGDSFGDFKHCSRIISMDCKNGHLWITWMNESGTFYYAHIRAAALVGDE